MSYDYQRAWEAMDATFQDLGDDLSTLNSRLRWRSDHSHNDAFPLRAHASFCRDGRPGDEDLVISLDFKWVDSGDGVKFTSDICRDDGEILADGPSARTDSTTDPEAFGSWLEDCILRTQSFIAEHEDLLRRELAQKP